MEFQELNNDQRREIVNTRQRYEAYRGAKAKADACRGSMVWNTVKGRQYLVRSYYDKLGIRRQSSIGPRSPECEQTKLEYDRGRREAEDRLKAIKTVINRQAAINRAIGLARVPLTVAKIIRALDNTGMLDSGIRVLGTNAIYAYEAAAGIQIDSGLTTTEDIDPLLESRGGLTFVATDDVSEQWLLHILQKVDHSFQKANQAFGVVNRDGYRVHLINPIRNKMVGAELSDLVAAEIEGLAWHESAPSFETVAIDKKGEPLRIVTTDPRVWAAHKLWLSKRQDRDPMKRRRDEAQARSVAQLVVKYFLHLPFVAEQMRMLSKDLIDATQPLFSLKQP